MAPQIIKSKIDIRLANNDDEERWNNYVQSYTNASPYHLFAWKIAVEEAYGHKGYYLMALNDDRVVGILPLIYLKPPLFSGQLVSLPFCDVGDVLTEDEDTKEKLVVEAVLLTQKLKTKYIELRGQYCQSSFQYLNLPMNTQSHKVRMILELPHSSEILWNNFKSKLRSQIQKAEKNNLRFTWGNIENLDNFYMVFSRNMRDLGSPVHSKDWFRAILQYYGENVHLGLVYHDKKLIGVGIMLSINKMVSVSWASTLRKYNHLSPNMLLYWNFLKYAADNRYTQFDFGRSTPDEGTYKFKAQWGAKPVPLYWNYIVTNTKKLKFNTSISTKRKRIEKLWQKLPLGLANYIGPVIRKHISL